MLKSEIKFDELKHIKLGTHLENFRPHISGPVRPLKENKKGS